MDYDIFKVEVARLWNGDILSYDEIKKIDQDASILIALMENSTLDFEMQNALDNYIIYYKQHHNLDEDRTNNLIAYNRIVNESNNQKLANERQNKPKAMQIKPINSNGVISAITVIEAVVIIGMLIAFLAIALLKI